MQHNKIDLKRMISVNTFAPLKVWRFHALGLTGIIMLIETVYTLDRRSMVLYIVNALVTIKLVGHSSMAMRYKFATSRRLLQTYKKRWETYKPSVSMGPYKSIKLDFSHNFINFEIRAREMIKAGEEQ
ncbi:hypothetical protein GQX74_004125 [Glossina fuscipes]|nr:hypothetical protein GQX74_004125 [Glossina fuscipes]